MAKGKYEYWLSPDGLLLLEAWARDGLTDEQISHNMGINPATLYRYKKDHNQICNALKKGKEVVDVQVENALLKRALGYKYKEVKTEKYMADGKPVKRVTETIKEVVPDVTAQIYWLKNRRPEQWRDKQGGEHGEQKEGVEIINDVPKETGTNIGNHNTKVSADI